MKSLLVLCLLLGASNAFIPAKMSTTLREFLEDLENPDALYRRQADADVAADLDCANVCPALPTLDLTATCEGNKWAPNYESKDGCECLTEYRCCSDSCPAVDVEQCYDNGQKGLYYGVKAKDCCDCPVLKCQKCIPPSPKEEVCGTRKYPLKCYEYIANATMDNETACFAASCSYKPPTPPENENCDMGCMKTDVKSTDCGADYKVCKKNRDQADCPNNGQNEAKRKIILDTGLGSHCFDEPEPVVDPEGGKFFDDGGAASGGGKACKPCKKWIFKKKNCTKMNEQARMEDCHLAGTDELDKKCFTKVITPDSCKCEHATCEREDNIDEQNKFGPDDKCPKNHKKVTGTTICLKARDVCVQCPGPIEPVCDFGSYVTDDTDCNGCAIKRCEKFGSVAPNGCPCGLYEGVGNKLYCTCSDDDKNTLAAAKNLG